MLIRNSEAESYVDSAAFHDGRADFDIGHYWSVIRRQWPMILTVTLCLIGLAVAYLLVASPKYTASTMVLIDGHKSQVVGDKQQMISDAPLDASTVESQAQVATSESVLLSVIRNLKLTQNPEFNGSDTGLIRRVIGQIMGLFSSNGPPSESRLERNVVDLMSTNLTAKRVGLTYVMEIDYTAKNANTAALIANSVANAYLASELKARYQTTIDASRWLEDRIKELRTQATAAAEAVRQFKSENNLVDTSRGLMSEQQLTDVNSQLVQAQAATAEAKAKLDRIMQVKQSDVPDASVTDALKDDVISRLRAQYLDLSAKEADWSARYGKNHTAAVNLRQQMAQIRKSIGQELDRIAQSYNSDYQIAMARQKAIQASLEKLVGESRVDSKAQVRLRDLESTAQTYRNLYDDFLQRSTEATQQQTLPDSEARIITQATPPLKPSSPKTMLVLAGSTVLGVFAGIGIAFARELMNNTAFRTGDQVEREMRLECLGTLPRISEPRRSQPARVAASGERQLPQELGLFRYVSREPFSRFAETLRTLQVAVNVSGPAFERRVIGMVSAVPHEGKTTVAANFANSLAQAGQRVLLIDSDLRHPSMTKQMLGECKRGLVTAMRDPDSLPTLLWRDPVTGIDFLPAETALHLPHTSEIISSPAMKALLSRVREKYDYVVLDLPPIAPVADVKAVGSLVDRFVMVVEWGQTSKQVVLEALHSIESVRERIIGVVLNKADAKALKRYEAYRGAYYNSYYQEPREAA